MAIRVRIVQTTVYEKLYTVEELQELCSIKGSEVEISDFLEQHNPDEVEEDIQPNNKIISSTWTVDPTVLHDGKHELLDTRHSDLEHERASAFDEWTAANREERQAANRERDLLTDARRRASAAGINPGRN